MIGRIAGEAARLAVSRATAPVSLVAADTYGLNHVATTAEGTSLICRCFRERDVQQLAAAAWLSSQAGFFRRQELLDAEDGLVVVASVWQRRAANPRKGDVHRHADAWADLLAKATAASRAATKGILPRLYPTHCQTLGALAAAGNWPNGDFYVAASTRLLHECARSIAPHTCVPQVVHGDLTPKNVLVHDGRACLIDFEYAHYGCAIAELGKWVAQGGYLHADSPDATCRLLSQLETRIGCQIGAREILEAAVVWCGDFRWIATARARGRIDIERYREGDLDLVGRLLRTHWVWDLLKQL